MSSERQERTGGPLTETEPGVLPTAIASEGEAMQAAYRFAVHDEAPAEIADDMDLAQQEVVEHIESIAG